MLMVPSNFAESNTILEPPKGLHEEDVASIFCFRGQLENGTNVVITCWKPTADELKDLNNGSKVWLFAMGTAQPPMKLTTVNPFED